jgi:hypothetical protein
VTDSGVDRLSAWLISLSAVDVLIPVIDILSLPLPRYVMSLPLSTVFILVALGLLLSLARPPGVQLVGNSAFAMLGLMALWTGLELVGFEVRKTARYDLTLECVPLLLIMIATRLHLHLFGDPRSLVSRFILLAGCLVLAHTALLLIEKADVPILFVNGAELHGRNSLAFLVPVCLWLLIFFPLKDYPLFSFRYNSLLALALANIMLSSARAAAIVLVWSVLVGLASQMPAARKWLRLSLLPLGIGVMVTVSLSAALLGALGESSNFIIGQGDDALSAASRSQSNAALLNKFKDEPLLGLGWEDVSGTKAYGYMGHTLYVNVVSGYGLIGALALVLLLVMMLPLIGYGRREYAEHFVFLAILIASFSNNVFVYFGLMIAFVGSAAAQTIAHKVKKNDH